MGEQEPTALPGDRFVATRGCRTACTPLERGRTIRVIGSQICECLQRSDDSVADLESVMNSSNDRPQGQSGGQPSTQTNAKAAPGGFQVEIKRRGSVVEISLMSADEYTAIELYEHLVRSTQKGSLHLDIGRV